MRSPCVVGFVSSVETIRATSGTDAQNLTSQLHKFLDHTGGRVHQSQACV